MGKRVDSLEKAYSILDEKAKKAMAKNAFVGQVLKQYAEAKVAMKPQLASCDANAEAFEKTKKLPSEQAKLEAQTKYFDQSAATFAKECAAAITKLTKWIDTQKQKKALGDADAAELLQGLKVLKTTLDAIDKSNESWRAGAQSAVDNLGKQMDIQAEMAKNFLTGLKGAVARGLAAAQRIKADPTPKTYNTEMDKAGRDITQQLGNINKLTASGHQLPPSIPANHAALCAALVPFGNGNMRTVTPTANPQADTQAVLAAITQFNKTVKTVVAGFGL